MTSAGDWAAAVGDAWAREWRRTDRSLAALSRHLDAAILAAAPPGPFRALDIGCGAGGTSLALAAARRDAAIVGVDLSAELIAVARERADSRSVLPRRREPGVAGRLARGPGLPPAQEHERMAFEVGDAIAFAAGHGPFELLVSRHGVMFFDDPVAAFAGLRAAAAPGGRLVFSCFRDRALNGFAHEVGAAAGIDPAAGDAPGPFAFADEGRVARILADAGWHDASATPVDFAYRVGAGEDPVGDALDFLQSIGPAAPAIRAAAPAARDAMLGRLAARLARRRVGDAIDFPAAAWIWSARA